MLYPLKPLKKTSARSAYASRRRELQPGAVGPVTRPECAVMESPNSNAAGGGCGIYEGFGGVTAAVTRAERFLAASAIVWRSGRD